MSDRPQAQTPSRRREPLLDGIDSPADLHEPRRRAAAAGRAGDARATSSTRSARSAATSAPTSAPASSPSPCTACSTRPRDKILWDVGHQAYPHKILTGRREELPTIRQYEGLAPFCSIFESEHDIMGAGHASTSIGYAVGLKEAMRKGIGEDGRVVAVIGDGALTGGVAYEALHAAGGLQTPIVIVLNDNGMSISPNVGALSRYFNRVRLNPRLYHAREGVEDRLTKLPLGLGKRIERLGPGDQVGDQGLLGAGPLLRGARPRLHGRDRRPRRRTPCARRCARPSRPTARSSSTSTRSRARASRPPRRAASRGWRSGTRRSRSSIVNGAPAAEAGPGQGVRLARGDRAERLEKPPRRGRRRSTRRSSPTRWSPRPSATSA